jgi:hypothetical protein
VTWTNRDSALAARVEALEAIEAIRALKARYAELVDSRYGRGGAKPPAEIAPIAAAIAALFAEDAVWDGGALGVCAGRDAIRARMAEPTLSFSRHYFVSPRIALDGDRATAHWELLAPCTSNDGAAMWMAGTEDDSYAKIDGVWLHTRMQLRVHFFAPHERGWAPARKG